MFKISSVKAGSLVLAGRRAFKARSRVRGSAMAEFVMCFLVIFLLLFLPMINLSQMLMAYSALWYLNQREIEEVSGVSPRTAGVYNPSQAIREIDDQFLGTGLAKFLGVGAILHDRLAYEGPQTPPVQARGLQATQALTGRARRVFVQTRVRIKPFLIVPIPGLQTVPGLNAPYSLTVSDLRLQEARFEWNEEVTNQSSDFTWEDSSDE